MAQAETRTVPEEVPHPEECLPASRRTASRVGRGHLLQKCRLGNFDLVGMKTVIKR